MQGLYVCLWPEGGALKGYNVPTPRVPLALASRTLALTCSIYALSVANFDRGS